MADISKCDGTECNKRLACWRYLAPPDDHWQSYITPAANEPCEHFWQTKYPVPTRKEGK